MAFISIHNFSVATGLFLEKFMNPQKSGILLLLGVVAIGAVGTAAYRPESGVQVFGFCTLIVVQLLALLRQTDNADKVQEANEENTKNLAIVAARVEKVRAVAENVTRTAAVKAEEIAAKVEQVSADLASNTAATISSGQGIASMKTVVNATNVLINGKMEAQLLLTKNISRRLANVTKAKADIDAADLASQNYDEYVARQKIIDQASKEMTDHCPPCP